MIHRTLASALKEGEHLLGKDYENLYQTGRFGSRVVIYSPCEDYNSWEVRKINIIERFFAWIGCNNRVKDTNLVGLIYNISSLYDPNCRSERGNGAQDSSGRNIINRPKLEGVDPKFFERIKNCAEKAINREEPLLRSLCKWSLNPKNDPDYASYRMTFPQTSQKIMDKETESENSKN